MSQYTYSQQSLPRLADLDQQDHNAPLLQDSVPTLPPLNGNSQSLPSASQLSYSSNIAATHHNANLSGTIANLPPPPSYPSTYPATFAPHQPQFNVHDYSNHSLLSTQSRDQQQRVNAANRPMPVVGSQGRRGILPSTAGRAPPLGSGLNGTSFANGTPLKNSEGKYPCGYCTKTYQHLKHLKRHHLRPGSTVPTTSSMSTDNAAVHQQHYWAGQPRFHHQGYGDDQGQAGGGAEQPTESNTSSRSSTAMQPTSSDSDEDQQLAEPHNMPNSGALGTTTDPSTYSHQTGQQLSNYDYARYAMPQYQHNGQSQGYYVDQSPHPLTTTSQIPLSLHAQAQHSMSSYPQYQAHQNHQQHYPQAGYDTSPGSQTHATGWPAQYLQHGVQDQMMYNGQ
ncbi:MAG: hypothetical protein M1828_000931 [Chrysothrix sp. TS-e1954]|nr:MAG: hypothetical protein M1828_000931 [Chrysothrix sp. TS-e1954]